MITISPSLEYVSAKCGTGKTTATVNYIAEHRYDWNYLYVVPTQDLMNSVQEAFGTKDITAHTISSVTDYRAVATNINKYLNNAADFGHVLIVTKEAYKHIPHFNRRDNWKIVVDEIPQVDAGHKLNLPRNMDKISSRVERGREVNEYLVQIVAKDPKELRMPTPPPSGQSF